jgi:hypothetical protein
MLTEVAAPRLLALIQYFSNSALPSFRFGHAPAPASGDQRRARQKGESAARPAHAELGRNTFGWFARRPAMAMVRSRARVSSDEDEGESEEESVHACLLRSTPKCKLRQTLTLTPVLRFHNYNPLAPPIRSPELPSLTHFCHFCIEKSEFALPSLA